MNKQTYRLVFNKARGCLMAVAETATSSGKSASGEGVSSRAKKRTGQPGGGAMQRAMLLSATSLWLAPMLTQAQTVATRIVADPAAARSQQATVLNASNGVTQVNIQTPSQAGVSRNTYSQFDVGNSGAILNNSRNNVQTQLGGWVQGNPWLATGSARVILNEVNANNPSQLQGYVEVAGQRAEVVVANPAGIAVNGGGFINASGVTLTTGSAVMNNGSLEGYRVTGGSISFDGAGLDTRGADYTAILARAAQVNAGIWANRLQVVTGSNTVQAASLGTDSTPQVQHLDGDASVPNYALDVSSLGGMYAGKITLIGTEAGLGVRNAGVVQASSGPLTLSQDGWLANSGTLQATGGDAAIQARGAIDQSGTIYSSGNVQLTSQAGQTHSGTVAALGGVSIKATGDGAGIQASSGAVWAAGLQTDGKLTGQQDLNVQASSQVQTAGRALATRNLALQGASLDLSQSGLQANAIQLQAGSGDLVARGSQVLAAETLQLNTPQALVTDGAQVLANTLLTQANSLSNVGGQIIQTGTADQSIALQGKLDNTAGMIQSQGHNLAISAGNIDNTAGQLLHAGSGAFNLDSQGLLQNSAQGSLADGGRIVGSGALRVQAQSFANSGSVNAGQDLNTTAATLDNRGTMYAAGSQSISVTYGMANSGTVAAAGNLTINAASLAGSKTNVLAAGMAAEGKLTGVGALTIDIAGALQSAGQVLATGNVSLYAASLDLSGSSAGSTGGNVNLAARSGSILTRQADVSTPGQLTIAAGQLLDNTGGQLSGQQLQVQAGQLDNSRGLIQQTGVGSYTASILSAGALNNNSGSIVANAQDFTVNAGGAIANNDGLVSAIGNLAVSGGDLSNLAGTGGGEGKGLQSQKGNISLNVQTLLNSGNIYAAQDLSTLASALTNSGTMYAGGQQWLTVRNGIASSGTIAAGKDLTVGADSLAGSGSNVLAAGMSASGQLSGIGKLSINTKGGLQTGGQVLATGNVDLNAASLDLAGSATGSTAGNVNLTAQSGNLSTRQAQLSTPGQLTITGNSGAGQKLDNTEGRISAAQLNLDLRNIDNTKGSIQQTGNADLTIDLHGGAFNNDEGSLVANAANLNLRAGALTNTAGEIGHSGTSQLNLSASSIDNTRGQIVGNGAMVVADTGKLSNADGLISAHGDLSVTSLDLANTASGAAGGAAGIQSQAGNVRLDVQDLSNSGSIRAGKDLDTHASALSNSGTMYAAGVQTVAVGNAITSSGTIAAGKDLTVNAGSLSGTATNVLAAGMAADGQISGTGALSITTAGALQTAGQALGAGNVNLSGASLDLSGSATGSTKGDVSLAAQSGSLLTRQAQVSAPGQLTITASQLLDNTDGQLGGQQLRIDAGQVDNTRGAIQQTGTGVQAASIHSTSALNNSSGRIVANAQDFTVASGALTNTDGVIGHAGAGSLDIATASVTNSHGQITGNGAATVTSTGNVDNSGGLIAAQNDLTLTGADLTNTSGPGTGIQSQAGSVNLNVQKLANSGSINAGQNLATHAVALDNSGTMYAAGAQTLAVGNAITSSGTIAAGKDLTVNAGSFSGTASNVLAAGMSADGQINGTGALSITTAGVLQTAGQALGAGNVNLSGASLDLSGSTTGSTKGDVSLAAQSGSLLTRQAQVSAPGQLTITASQLLDNTDGQLGGQQLRIDAGQVDNTRGAIQQTGTGVQAANIHSTGALNNSSGRIVANAQDFTFASGALTNTDGVIGHAGAGLLDIATASVTNSHGQITGNGAATVTSTGNVDNSGGLIAAQNDLTLTGADLTNASGAGTGIQSQAGSINLNVQKLANSGSINAGQNLATHASALSNSGTMYAAGVQTLAVGDAITSSGTIAAGKGLTVTAGNFSGTASNVLAAGMAADGQISGTGALSITTAGALQTVGQALGAGNVNLSGASLDLSGSTTGSTKGDVSLAAQSGSLLTRQAQVSAPGQLTITASQLLDNTDGQLGGQQLRIDVGQVDNTRGAIQQTGIGMEAASIHSNGALNNSSGRIVANAQDFTLASGALTNTDGVIGHAGTGSLDITSSGIDNSRGQITGNGTATLTSTGNVVNAGGLIAAQNDLAVTSADLANSSGAPGTVTGIQSQAGNVSLNVQQFTNSGSVRAGNDLDTHAASLNNSGTMYAADGQTVAVVNAVTSSGTIAAGKDLTINAGSLAGTGANVLAAGMAGDGKLTGIGALTITTAGALKTAGQILASGNLNLTGANLDLSGCTAGSTGGNVSLTAQSGNVLTRQAQVSTPGQLTIAARNNAGQLLDNTDGLLSGQQVQVQAGQVNNTRGVILQSGTGPQVAGIESLGAFNNNAGRIVANAQDFTLTAGGSLSNVDGQIGHAGAGALEVSAGSLDNTRGQIVGNGAATVASSGTINNSDGLLSAQQTLSVDTAGLNNSQGKLVSMQGTLSMHSAQGAVTNAGGLIQAAQDLGLTLDGAGNTLQNAQGKIIAGHDATLSTGSVTNDAGLIAAGHDLRVDTHGQSLSNLDGATNAGALGLVASGQMTISSGAIDNRAGLISAQSGVDITSGGAINNASRNGHAGQIYSGGNLNVQATGMDNTGGQVLAVQGADIQLGSGTLSNSAGLVRAGQTLSLKAGAIDNSATLGGNTGLEANTVNIVTANLNNAQGAVRAGQDLTIHSDGQVTNNQGELSAGRALQITTDQAGTPSLSINNTAGQIVADQSVNLRTGTLVGAGSIVSRGDVGLDLQGDHTFSGTLQAGGNLQLQATGSLTNPISLQAGRNLTVNAGNLDNLAGAELLSGETTTLGVAGTLTNHGLIDGADTHIQASAVNNLGTGRIYGDRVAVAAGVVNNLEETVNGVTTAATIAGRERVDIGAQYLTNREGALIYSGGDLAIGGALDGNWQANGTAQTINNNSATIEAAQNLAISASDIRNTNEHFATEIQQVSQSFITEYQGKDAIQRYDSSTPGVYVYLDESEHLHTPDGNYEKWFKYQYTRTVNESVVTQTDPGKIIAGGGIRLTANSILNDKSQIVAGGRIDILGGSVNNTRVDGSRTTTESGTANEYWRDFNKGIDTTGHSSSGYWNGPIAGTFDMRATRYEEFAGGTSTGTAPQDSNLSAVQARASAGGNVGASSGNASLNNVSGTHTGNAAGAATSGQTNGQVQSGTASGAQAQGGAIAGNTGKQVIGNAAHSGQAVDGAIGDNTGRQVTGNAASSAQAQNDAVSDNTGRKVLANTADSGLAQGDATAQHTAGQVGSLSGASAQAGNAPNATGASTGSSRISIRTMQPNFRLPTASLFKTHPESQARYLIETDPKFTQYKSWLSSDYMLDALQVDPATTQKRMGDGFYEQKLVREQVLTLTGQRFLGDYRNDDEEYKALMDNGLTYARQWGLRPGVSLTPEQVSQLTSDIVWLVTQEVQLPDGSKQSVLVPQVYVRVQPGDLDGSDALLAGKEVNINLTGDFTNSGSVAGRNLVNISADNIRNMGGTMSAGTLALQAAKDIDNIGGTLKAQNAALLSAGRDLNLTSTTQSSSSTVGANSFAQTGIDRVAGLYVSAPAGVLLANAGNNINLTAAKISNEGTGLTQLNAGNNLNLSAVNTSVSQRIVWDSNNHQSQSASMDVGSQVKGGGNLVLGAGQDINAKAAAVSAGQTLNVAAGRDLNITAGEVTQSLDEADKHTSKGFLSKKTISSHTQLESSTALGTSLEGSNVNVLAGRDLTVKGSSIIADQNLTIDAARNLSILSVEDTAKSAHSTEVKKSGLTGGYASGNLSAGYGKSSTSTQSSSDSVTQHESTIGALNGSAKLKSGETLQVVASDIAAKENLTLIGKNVDLSAAQNTSDNQQSAQSKSSGFAVGVTVNPLAAFKDAYKADTENSKSSGTIGKITSKADSVADGLWAATTAVSVQFGSKSSNSNQNQSTSDARTTSLNAGKDLTILATDGSINSQGTQMSAEGNALIVAKDSIKFDVAHNTESKSQDSKASGFSFDNRSALMAGTFNNKGKGDGATDTVTGTKLSVGGSTTMATQTGDIALIGANVVSDGKLAISAARDLTITSAQDTVHNANQSDNKAVGKVVISDTERFVGYHNEKHKDNADQVTQVASNVASLKGDVVLSAGEKYTQTSSNVLAGNDVNITAKSIDITALQDTGSSQSSNSDLKIGAFARISSPLIDLVNNVDAARKSDSRLKAMQGMAAAAQGYQVAKAVTNDGILFKGEVGVGFASSSNASNDKSSTAVGSTINGGGNVTLTSTAGDIHATGATLGAGKALTLDSAQNIVLDASQSTLHNDGKNHSSGVEVGVGFQVGAQGTGVYAYASASVGNGHNNSDTTVNNNTQLKADTLNITSKGDTTLKGATATANTINADVGGKLAIESLQDVSKQESSQTSAGARVQVSFGTAWSASGNVSQSNTSGSSAMVGQQSGLFAGDGGYHVKADTVDLKGGAIASTNKVDSELTTNKLTTSNLENKMNYSASSVSLAGSIGGGSGEGDKNADGTVKPKDQQQLFGDRKSGNVTPGLPIIEKGSDSSTTYATVTDGKITIGGVTTNSVKDLGINTDASKANTALDKLPDLQKVLKEQQAMSAAAGTVVATSKQIIGEIASDASKAASREQAKALDVLKDPNSTDEQKAAANAAIADAQKTQAGWAPGGIYSRALNAGVEVLVGSLAGQSGGQITANAMGPTVAKTVGDIGSSLAKEAYGEARKYEDLAEKARRNNDLVAAEEYTAKAAAADATSANWGDNGIFRVGLHATTQGLLGSIANGQSAGLEGAAGVVGGNLGQQLGEKLGNAEADRLGLKGPARDALVNAYQQTGAVVGGMVAGAAAAGVSGNTANGAALLAAAQGSQAAQTVDSFNRKLHKADYENAKKLAKLSKGKYTEKQIQDALKWAGITDGKSLLVEPGRAESFTTLPQGVAFDLNARDGWKPIANVIGDLKLEGVKDQPGILREILPGAPDAALVSFIQENMGDKASPYVFAKPKDTSNTQYSRFPPAPEGTTRISVNVGGVQTFPLRADCPLGCDDAIAHIYKDDPGNRAYEQALKDQLARDSVLGVLSLINPFVRGWGLIATPGRTLVGAEAGYLAREAGSVGSIVPTGAVGEGATSAFVNRVGTATSSDIDAVLQTSSKNLPGTGTTQEVRTVATPNSAIPQVGATPPKAEVANSAAQNISSDRLGEFINKGGNKDVYAFGDDQAIGVLKQGKRPELISEELLLLNKLDEAGIPTVNAKLINVDGKPGIIMDKFAQGSKDVVRLEGKTIKTVGESPYLNEQSVKDLTEIRRLMVEKNIKVDDLQFLIAKDGRVVVADPLDVSIGVQPPSAKNLRMIDLLIKAAKRN